MYNNMLLIQHCLSSTRKRDRKEGWLDFGPGESLNSIGTHPKFLRPPVISKNQDC